MLSIELRNVTGVVMCGQLRIPCMHALVIHLKQQSIDYYAHIYMS